MNETMKALMLIAGGAVAGVGGGAALVRESTVAPVYYVHDLAIQNAAQPDGGTQLNPTAFGYAYSELKDGGVARIEIDNVNFTFDPKETAAAKLLLDAAGRALKNAQ